MSQTLPVNATPSSSSNFQLIFSTAVRAYERQTKKDLLSHTLACQLQKCDSPASVLVVLQSQVDDLDQARKTDERLTRWLGPTINVLLAFSDTLGEGVSLVSVQGDIVLELRLRVTAQVFSPAKVIFAGAGVLLQVGILLDLSLQPEL
jgi:hypothetical protein